MSYVSQHCIYKPNKFDEYKPKKDNENTSWTYPKKKMKTQTVLSLADSHHIGSKHNQK